MLGLEEIAKLISAPEGIQESQLVDLEKFTQNYPYTSLFSQLYLLGSKIHGKVNFDEELNKHAFRISDRSNLYFLIQDGRAIREVDMPESVLENESQKLDTEAFERVEKEHIVLEDPVINEVQDNEEQSLVESIVDHSTKNIVPSEFGIAELEGLEFVQIEDFEEDAEETLTEDGTNAKLEENGVAQALDDQVNSSNETGENDLLEENLQLHLISSGYFLDELSQEEELALDEHQSKKTEVEEASREVDNNEERLSAESNPSSFISWLHADKNYSSPLIVNPSDAQETVDEFAAFNPVDQLSGDQERPKKEFFSPSKKAKESLNESTVPVSETLAKIFVLQGNYSKAIQVYEQLMLNYPEKKVFFANSIQQIKEKINNIA